MGRTAPDKPSRRRQNDTAQIRRTTEQGQRRAAVSNDYDTLPAPRTATTASAISTSTPNRSIINMSSSSSTTTTASTPLGLSRSSLSPIIPSRPSYAGETSRSLGVISALELPSGREVADDHSPSDFSRLEEQLKAFFARQEEFNKRLEERQAKQEIEKPSKRLPKHLTAAVRDAYKHLHSEDGEHLQWNLNKLFSDQENQRINNMLLAGIRSTDGATSTVQIRAAMKVYFQTKRRQQKIKDSNKEEITLQAQRRRSRLNMKKTNRLAALMKSSSITGQKKREMAKYMTVEYMSSEESMSEDEPVLPRNETDEPDSSDDDTPQRKKVLVCRPLAWRSQDLDNLIKLLDRKILRKKTTKSATMSIERRTGQPSRRAAPEAEVIDAAV